MSDDASRAGPLGETPAHDRFRATVRSHRDPESVDCSTDRVTVAGLDDDRFDAVRRVVGTLYAAELATARSLGALLAAADPDERAALAAAAAADARHADFLARYWATVLGPEAHARGNDVAGPTDDRWLPAAARRLLDGLDGNGTDPPGPSEDDPDALDDTEGDDTRSRHAAVAGLLVAPCYRALGAVADGEGPALPGLAAWVEHARGEDAALADLLTGGGDGPGSDAPADGESAVGSTGDASPDDSPEADAVAEARAALAAVLAGEVDRGPAVAAEPSPLVADHESVVESAVDRHCRQIE